MAKLYPFVQGIILYLLLISSVNAQDSEPPNISSFEPDNGSSNFSVLGRFFSFQANEPVRRVGGKKISIIRTNDSATISEITTSSSTSVSSFQSFSFDYSVLDASTLYHIEIENGAFVDESGNALIGIISEDIWSFTTQEGETDPPLASTLSPENNDIDISVIRTNFSITLNESVREIGGKTVNIRRVDNDELIVQTSTTESSFFSTLGSFNFFGLELQPSTSYYVQVESGSFVDAFGNPFTGISSKDSWTFTTQNPESDAPVLRNLSPTNGETGVLVTNSTLFSIEFDEGVRQVAGKKISLFRTSDNQLTSELVLNSSSFFGTSQTFVFNELFLEPSTDYHIIVESESFEDPFGNAFAGILENDQWSFTTQEPETDPPMIRFLVPSSGERGVSVAPDDLQIDFDEGVSLSGGKRITIRNLADNSITYQIITEENARLDQTWRFSVPVLLEPSTDYYVTIESGTFVDLFGNEFIGITDDSTWRFITQDAETEAPVFTVLSPTNGASDISVLPPFFNIGFNEKVQQVPGKKFSLIRKSDDIVVSSVLSNGERGFNSFSFFNIIANIVLEPEAEYYINIEAGSYIDVFGNEFEGISDNSTWSFTTESAETDPPVIELTFPQSEFAPIQNNLYTLTFNESIQALGCKNIRLINSETGEEIVRHITVENSFFTDTKSLFLDNDVLDLNTTYHIVIDEGAFADRFGNPSPKVENPEVLSFTTGVAETDPPVISEIIPENKSFGVRLNQNRFTVSFNEDVKAIEGKTITLKQTANNEVISELVFGDEDSFDFNDTFSQFKSFSFSRILLEPGTEYFIEIEPGTFIDTSGNPFEGIEGPEVWSFVTMQSEGISPVVNLTSPSSLFSRESINRFDYTIVFDEFVKRNEGFKIEMRKSVNDSIVAEIITSEDSDLSPGSSEFNTVHVIVFDNLVLEPNTQYYILIDSGAFEDFFGNTFLGIRDKNFWTFVTIDIESEPPFVIQQSPLNRNSNIPVTRRFFSLFFNETISEVSGKSIELFRTSDDLKVGEAIIQADSFDVARGFSFSFENLLLEPLTEYYVNIDSGAVVDAFGNPFAGIDDNISWTFTTQCRRTDPPTVRSLSPINDESEVSPVPGNSFLIEFNRPVRRVEDIDISINREADDTRAISSTEFEEKQFEFSHEVFTDINLAPSTTYYILIPAGTFVDGFGNEFEGILTSDGWSFTTANVTNVEEDLPSDLVMYPVPVENNLFIGGSDMSIDHLAVYSLGGDVVLQKTYSPSNNIEIDLSTLMPGVYLVKLHDGIQNKFYTQRIIKK